MPSGFRSPDSLRFQLRPRLKEAAFCTSRSLHGETNNAGCLGKKRRETKAVQRELMSDLLQRLIVHIADFVREEGGELTKTKLVKLLYLIDLNTYRHFRSTLTQVRWFYHLYGPYAFEIDSAIRAIEGYDLTESQFLSGRGRKGFAYKATVEEDLHALLPLDRRQVIYNTLRRWAIEDLNTILDYVYFQTPPMKGAHPEELLDFSRVPPAIGGREHKTQREVPIPQRRMEELRQRYRESVERRRQRAAQVRVVRPPLDHVYVEALRLLHSEEKGDLEGLSGKIGDMTQDARQALSEQS